MIAFAIRNLKLYFRDKGAVFFSLLAILIEIGLYVLFLGDVWTKDVSMFDGAREMMDNWVMAGVLATTGVTTSLVVLGNIVRDKEYKKIKDFVAAPVKNSKILMGYWIAAYVIGMLMSLITLAIAQAYIVWDGGSLIKPKACLTLILLLFVTNLMSTALMLLFVACFKTNSAFSAANTILGTLIGFLTGIYLPIGMYPEGVQWLIRLFPVSHAASLFRRIMMGDVMETSFDGVPADIVLDIKEQFGVVYKFGEEIMTFTGSMSFIIVTAVVCYLLAFFLTRKKQK
ncbi:multidrug/hemolysin transport system permease protein [Kineothrix alysoides]|uniref:Multidrug/hemolysin transport system permease protein n=1 Tax=Kineothrix alysoides TaxID=1469948 RepID=A0A4R1R139_9FIRM|nr:ABC transporter permease [Kineothrix alysoides]TCL59033.1 multidrug/hemolysin transport system permease protein [Kineothrix alysoides]